MKKIYLKSMLAVTLAAVCGSLHAQPKAELVTFPEEDGTRIYMVSDNGLWAVGSCLDNFSYDICPHLYNLTTNEDIVLAETGQRAGAWDVTDDGRMVVGSYDGYPAYYKDGQWTQLPIPEGIPQKKVWGKVKSVTPDGKKMIGYVWEYNTQRAKACIWEDGKLTEPTLPAKDRFGDPSQMNQLWCISADGNTVVGALSATEWPNCTVYYLDKDGKCNYYGTEHYQTTEGEDSQTFYSEAYISPNGRWIVGQTHYDNYPLNDGDARIGYIFDMESGKTLLLEDYEDRGLFAADNRGVCYGSYKLTEPVREVCVYLNQEFVDLKDILAEKFGIDFIAETGYEATGTLMSVSADGKVIAGLDGAMLNWILKLPCNLADLDDYILSIGETEIPAARVTVNGRDLALTGDVKEIILTDLSGKIVYKQPAGPGTLRMPGLAQGTYLATLTNGQGRKSTAKIIIK